MLNTLLIFATVSLLMLRSIYSQGPARVALDALFPQVHSKINPETLNHDLRQAQNQD